MRKKIRIAESPGGELYVSTTPAGWFALKRASRSAPGGYVIALFSDRREALRAFAKARREVDGPKKKRR